MLKADVYADCYHSSTMSAKKNDCLCFQCNLHIHAAYSISQTLDVPMAPLTAANAVGLIIAHGNIPFSLSMISVLPFFRQLFF